MGSLEEYVASKEKPDLGLKDSILIGMVQGICLPFRGFSRSGATISTGLILGIEKKRLEDFSFALAVILTPPVILREAIKIFKGPACGSCIMVQMPLACFSPSLIGMVLSFISGILALKWLSHGLRVAVGIYSVSIVYVLQWSFFS